MQTSITTRRKKSLFRILLPYLFVLPALLIHLIMVTIPAVSSFRLSLTNWNLIGAEEWCGFDNYVMIFSEKSGVGEAVLHNLIWMAIFMVVPIVLGSVVAVLVSRIKHGQMFFRTALFMPYVISSAVAGRIWHALYNPYYGVNAIFKSIGLIELSKVQWIGKRGKCINGYRQHDEELYGVQTAEVISVQYRRYRRTGYFIFLFSRLSLLIYVYERKHERQHVRKKKIYE